MRLSCLLILACLTFTACGTKGPLYIPERQYPQEDQKAPTTQQPNEVEVSPAP
ncbi:LPS translocon maturation chaperone LptM [Methylicorpusculum sp.]|uniref:LPS translocon maturation chaperone LptM n=1 Tax=Methylicorpusculum sp. TaxID=2713644 RepID=UPI003A102435